MYLKNKEERELWKKVAVKVAASPNTVRTCSAPEYADAVVEAYRERISTSITPKDSK